MISKVINLSVTLVILSFTFFSCDVIEPGKYEKVFEIDTTVKVERKQNILISEYTGHKCGNCPPAAEEAKRLQSVYGKDRVSFMSIHVGIFATPDANYPNNLRAVEGLTLNNQFSVTSYPIGDVNRLVNSESKQRNFIHTEWQGLINSIFTREAPVLIEFEDATYNSNNRTITANVKLDYYENVTTNDFIAIYIVEDSIVSAQTDYRRTEQGLPDKVPDYVHYGVLRGVMNGVWGDPVNDKALPKTKDKYNFSFTYTIPSNRNWRAEHIRLIAIVHDNNQTFQISQVKDTHLTLE